MVRTQVQLTEEQAGMVKRIAAEQRVSVSEVVRRSIEAFACLQAKPSREEIRRRALLAVGAVKGGPRDLSINHNEYAAEAFEH